MPMNTDYTDFEKLPKYTLDILHYNMLINSSGRQKNYIYEQYKATSFLRRHILEISTPQFWS